MPGYELYCGDAIEVLRTLPAGSVQTCVTSPPYYGLRRYMPDGHPDRVMEIGAEFSPEEYVERLVAVFREVRRVLRDDGTLWCNLGDSFWGGKGKSGYELPHEAEARRGQGKTLQHGHNVPGYVDMRPTDGKHPVIKPKDMIGIPWMAAFALRADGWYLRSDIVWAKPNPMPESVTDRPTKSHEYIFLLSKSKKYFYDHEAIKEPNADPGRTNYTPGNRRFSEAHKQNTGDAHRGFGRTGKDIDEYAGAGRNKRSVWYVPTRAYKGAHYATFPPDLIEPCILAGSSPKCCAKCGAPWERVVERVPATSKDCPKTQAAHEARGGTGRPTGTVGKSGSGRIDGYSTTIGWTPTCTCDAGVAASVVLDPFYGSGTTGSVAIKHGRNFIGIDLDERNLPLAHDRIGKTQPLLLEGL